MVTLLALHSTVNIFWERYWEAHWEAALWQHISFLLLQIAPASLFAGLERCGNKEKCNCYGCQERLRLNYCRRRTILDKKTSHIFSQRKLSVLATLLFFCWRLQLAWLCSFTLRISGQREKPRETLHWESFPCGEKSQNYLAPPDLII